MSTPTQKEFLDLVEQIFGSRSPNLQAHAAQVERRVQEWRARDTHAVEKEFLRMKETHLKATIRFSFIGLNSWEELTDEMKVQFVDVLTKSVEEFDREEYLFAHPN